jgi:hypothetical protein
MIVRLSREPLVHFLLIGLLLFLLYAALGGSGGDRSIRIDDKVVANLAAQFERTWQRPPSDVELEALVDSHIREEIFYREGIALGLDRDDPTIKRRITQKFAVLAEESEDAASPTDAQLDEWLRTHADRYAEPTLTSFQQLMVDPAAHGGSAEAAVQAAREALANGADPAEIGTSRMIPARFDLYPLDLVERDFGPGFARQLNQLRDGSWEGPVRSGYGIHLVKVEIRVPGRVPPLDQVRKAVARDFEADRRAKAASAYYKRLREEYRVEMTASLPRAAAKPR